MYSFVVIADELVRFEEVNRIRDESYARRVRLVGGQTCQFWQVCPGTPQRGRLLAETIMRTMIRINMFSMFICFSFKAHQFLKAPFFVSLRKWMLFRIFLASVFGRQPDREHFP